MPIVSLEDRVFLLSTRDMSYVVYIERGGALCGAYWGPRMDRIEDFADETWLPRYANAPSAQYMMEECSAFGNMRFKETSLKLCHPDGTRDFRYAVEYKRVEGDTLTIALRDVHYPVRVKLCYRVYEQENILEKWRVVENLGGAPVRLDRVYSGEFGLDGMGWQSLNYNGHWAGEFQACSEEVACGKITYESLRGNTGHAHAPAFVLHQNATEDSGDVFFGMLAWSGNFKVVAQPVESQYVSLLIGVNDTDFAVTLGGGETFTTPSVYAGYARGFTAMTHALTDFARARIMPRRLADAPLPVLYNAWEAVEFHVDEAEQMRLAEVAARLGVELFVVDDGWFKGRNGDAAGLGDWVVDRKKFPRGLGPLIEHVKRLGMRFGLWIEPEMVNEDSDLYRAHPEWIYRYESRPVLTFRNQYMLDMTNPDVVQYLFGMLDALLRDNDIAYVKWDMNRYASEAGSRALAAADYPSIWYRHVEGVYALIHRLREAHPEVEWECCSSGGGRVDYGAMAFFDEFWTSDNTDPLDRLSIQWGYSLLYPVRYMRAWLTSGGNLNGRGFPMAFYAHAAMCGAFGIGRDLNAASEGELAEMAGYVSEYKRLRDVVQLGKLYRLARFEAGRDSLCAVQYVKDGRSVLFAFSQAGGFARPYHRLRLKGLAEGGMYSYAIDGETHKKSGAWLMRHGIDLKLQGAYVSRVVEFEREA